MMKKDFSKKKVARPPQCEHCFGSIEQIMKRDLFTVLEGDFVDVVADLMHERNIRHVPVENDAGDLVGLVSSKQLVEYYSKTFKQFPHSLVKDIMLSELITVSPETQTVDAIQLMEDNKVSCLPVVKDRKLVGLVTEYDFVGIAADLLKKIDTTIPIQRK